MCYRCDRSGHIARDCPDSADRGSRGGGSVCYRSVQSQSSGVRCPLELETKVKRWLNDGSQRFYNHREGPYLGLLLDESAN